MQLFCQTDPQQNATASSAFNLREHLNIAALSRTTYWHGMRGGMDVHGKLIAQGLAARGHRVVFISTSHPSGKAREEIDGVEIHYLKNTVFGSRRSGWAEESVHALEVMHKQHPFDLIWSQSYDGFGVTRNSGTVGQIPMLATLHGSIQQEYTSFLANIGRGWKRPMYPLKAFSGLFYSYFITQKPVLRHSRGIVTVSRRVVEDLGKWFGRSVTGKCKTIYNGVNIERFRPDEAGRRIIRRHYAIQENETVLLTLGRLTREKGHHLLIEVLEALQRVVPEIRLLVVGEGESMVHLKATASRLGLSEAVIFAGSVDNAETASYYNASDIFVFPTLTVEGLPFVLLEAMACGKPIIASEIGGTVEAIQGGENGILIKPGDKAAITRQIAALIHDRNLAERLGSAAEATVRRDFSIERMIDLTEKEMHRIADESAPSSIVRTGL
ncbi:MAG TPA: glycosyltransferase family 4 protein [Syntrophales bacterium]|nr:glycosyltransferase family 4 protein [Syntrophales bacterium]